MSFANEQSPALAKFNGLFESGAEARAAMTLENLLDEAELAIKEMDRATAFEKTIAAAVSLVAAAERIHDREHLSEAARG